MRTVLPTVKQITTYICKILLTKLKCASIIQIKKTQQQQQKTKQTSKQNKQTNKQTKKQKKTTKKTKQNNKQTSELTVLYL